MKSHEIDYKIMGNGIQLVEIELDPMETVIAEAGAMMYMESGIDYETKMGDGSNPSQGFFDKLLSAGSRMIAGESVFITHFTNRALGKKHVAFTSPYPGTIIPINLAYTGSVIAQKDAFLCAALGTKLSITFNRRLGAGLFGGEGFILERLDGDGMAFLHSCGAVVERYLNNEELRIDTGCIVAFEPQIDYNIQLASNLKTAMFGGEGLFLATLRGTGRVWLQNMPIRKLIQALQPNSPNSNKENQSLLNNLFEH
ncbi:MAG: TIGR00266 family protein [Salinivirgaceae bacterium]|nr:TIGR00266 family protein [Salinivirgaceae bacterium]